MRPSPCLRLLQAGASLWALALCSQCAGLAWPQACGALCALAGAAGLLCLGRRANAHAIDISGVGQIRLTVYQHRGRADDGVQVELMAGSTLWPWLLVLRLRRPGGATPALLLVLPDSVARGAFRPLALACRALAARGL
ncbi:MAG: hypothetical protein V4724_37420 [Pseudomonadota bacterium]